MPTDQTYESIYLAGQTGAGKTSVAIELSRQLDGPVEVINADAYQVYRGLEIISAVPTPHQQASIPHHLFGVLAASEECDAAYFSELAKSKITEVANRAIPLVVGGSGLYLKAITHGLAPTPKGDPELRGILDQRPLENLVEEYRALDPDGAAITDLKNRRYVSRNLEICLLTGCPASKVKNEWHDNSPDIFAFYLERSREDVYDRINRRTLAMFQAGVVNEISNLGNLSATAAKAIGIGEIKSLISHQIGEEECIAKIQKITRRLAKRQEAWFKRETLFSRIKAAPNDSPQQLAGKICKELDKRQYPLHRSI